MGGWIMGSAMVAGGLAAVLVGAVATATRL
jgi:hypothetical protein